MFWLVRLNLDDWRSTECTCPVFMKKAVCSHSRRVCIRGKVLGFEMHLSTYATGSRSRHSIGGPSCVPEAEARETVQSEARPYRPNLTQLKPDSTYPSPATAPLLHVVQELLRGVGIRLVIFRYVITCICLTIVIHLLILCFCPDK